MQPRELSLRSQALASCGDGCKKVCFLAIVRMSVSLVQRCCYASVDCSIESTHMPLCCASVSWGGERIIFYSLSGFKIRKFIIWETKLAALMLQVFLLA
ncbi:DYW_deaminase domain-containing protein [Psidium guajava]|nr:DYW_deaminase domain-containing protein [Psidium guajava]